METSMCGLLAATTPGQNPSQGLTARSIGEIFLSRELLAAAVSVA